MRLYVHAARIVLMKVLASSVGRGSCEMAAADGKAGA
jgi:hypothetical protein